jgi:hypothetical protein
MEVIKFPQLNHEKSDVGSAFGLSFYEQHYIKSAILFEILSTTKLTKQIYNSVDEVPNNMSSMTGFMERALSHAKTLEQQLYMLFEYQGAFFTIKDMITEEPQPTDLKDLKEKLKTDPGSVLSKLLAELTNKAKRSPIIAINEAIEKSGHDFEKFIEIILPRDIFESMSEEDLDKGETELDKLIRQALKKDKRNDSGESI